MVGYFGVGKDVAAEFLEREKGWRRMAFSDPLCKGMLVLNPIILFEGGWLRLAAVVEMYGWAEAKKRFPEVRRLLQVYGTEAGRGIHGEDCWVKIAHAEIRREVLSTSPRPIVITGVRFPNEVAMLRQCDAKLIRVHRPGFGPGNSHSSESFCDSIQCDAEIVNDGTPEDLRAKIFAAAGY